MDVVAHGRPLNRQGRCHRARRHSALRWINNRLNGILDFEAAGFGSFLFDVAVAIHACCHDGKKFLLPQVKSFLKGYQSVRSFNAKERRHVEYYLFESAMRFLLTRLRDFELKDGPVKAKPFKDYRQYLRRFGEISDLVKKIMLF